jgi:glycosyltransferase involved in cell wall biosynthesis
LLHLTSPGAPLFAKTNTVVSPCGYNGLWLTVQVSQVQAKGKPFWERLHLAAAQGGLAQVDATLWPDDLPPPDQGGAVRSLPPSVHPDFFPAKSDHNTAGTLSELDLPDTYVLYHGPADQRSMRCLLAAWRWAAEPVGGYHPLLLLGLDADARTMLETLMSEYKFGDSIIPLPPLSPERVPTLYRNCSALFHPATVPPWGGAVRHALACGRPVVAAESPLSSALVGPTAYLAPVDDPRALGAALITVVVEEEVARDLAKAAKKRAAGWRMETFGERLAGVYERLGSRG